MAQTQLNQIVALEKGVKSRAQTDFAAASTQLQKAPLLSGISRTYKPKDDEGEQLPAESTRVQVRTSEVLADVRRALTRLFDVVLTKDAANGAAEAWSFDEATDAYATAPTQTTRSKKVPRNHVKAEATEKHPAQVEMYFE